MSERDAPTDAAATAAEEDERRYRRREVLIAGSVLTASGFIFKERMEQEALQRLLAGQPSTLTLQFLRPEDFLAFDVDLYNLTLLGPGTAGPGDPGTARLVRKDANKPAYVVAVFGAQAIVEEAFREDSDPKTKPPSEPPVQSRLSGKTKLAFQLTSGTEAIPFNDAALLDWLPFRPSLAPNAMPSKSSSPKPRAPEPTETAIEYPWRMVLSPGGTGAWAHSASPVSSNGRAELWHTRLVYRGGDTLYEEHVANKVRAIWTPDLVGKPEQGPGNEVPIRADERQEIVRLSSDFTLKQRNGKTYTPTPIDVNRLMVTSLGAWADLRVDFPPVESLPEKHSVIHYSDQGTMGRQHFVKVVKAGFLYPFGHSASLVSITERKLEKISSGSQAGRTAAYMRKREFLVVKERIKEYEERAFPFRSVEILTQITPNLDKYSGKGSQAETHVIDNDGRELEEDAFWPSVGAKSFQFELVARDNGGIPSAFTAPLIFTSLDAATDQSALIDVGFAYREDKRSKRPFAGQSVAYAPPSPGKSRDTAYDTDEIAFGVKFVEGEPGEPQFTPVMENATIRVPALEAIAATKAGKATTSASAAASRNGRSARRRGPEDEAKKLAGQMVVEPAKAYVDKVKNEAEMFLQAKKAEALDYVGDAAEEAAAELAGALGVPNMDIVGLSKTLGPVGGKLINGELPSFDELQDQLKNFNPADFLAADATFLGIDFKKVLLDALDLPSPEDIAKGAAKALQVPKFVTETVYETVEDIKDAKEAVEGAQADAEKALEDAKKEFEKAKEDLENRIPKEIRTEFSWEPALKSNNTVGFLAYNQKDVEGKRAKMRMHSLTVVPLNLGIDLDDPLATNPLEGNPIGKPQSRVTTTLENFGISLFGAPDKAFLIVYFNRLNFASELGQKPDVDVEVGDVIFQNELEFVNELRKLMSSPGLGGGGSPTAGGASKYLDAPTGASYAGNGFAIDVGPTGVRASYGVEFPTIAVGAFSISNMSLGALLEVPFTGEPVRASFNFCSPDRPFLLTYAIFGGGGYANIAVTAKGVESLVVSFEFGAAAAMNFGVASGSVQLMAGIVISQAAGEKVSLTGYVRLHGELDILGLITLTLDFNLSLDYDGNTGEAWGQATLTVEVEVACFSKSVSITAEKRFAGGGGKKPALAAGEAEKFRAIGEPAPGVAEPIRFDQLFEEPDWSTDYAGAFAGAAF